VSPINKHLLLLLAFAKGSKVYCAFLDASKAFDKVLHNGLFVKLLKKDVSVRFVRILQNWYSKLCTAIQRIVLSVMFLLFSVGYDKVELYHCKVCRVYAETCQSSGGSGQRSCQGNSQRRRAAAKKAGQNA